MVSHLFYTTEGVFGIPLGVSSTFIFLFILFGAYLEKTGLGKFFIDIANAIAGWASGGPAKVAVISSALQGTISGSSVANVVGSGSFTIPMMKKLGYKKDFAGAVEAAASTGGQLMPPIMGAAAFLMAEFVGVPYMEVVKAAVVPAIPVSYTHLMPREEQTLNSFLVCASTPLATSITMTALSTAIRVRYVSSEKSACPGVSRMFTRHPL